MFIELQNHANKVEGCSQDVAMLVLSTDKCVNEPDGLPAAPLNRTVTPRFGSHKGISALAGLTGF